MGRTVENGACREAGLYERYLKLQRENEVLRQEARGFRLKVHELEERIHDMLDPTVGTPVLRASARACVARPYCWFYEPAELAEVLTRMAKAHPEADRVVFRHEADRVVFRLGCRYVMAKSVAFEESPVDNDGDWYDPAVVFNIED